MENAQRGPDGVGWVFIGIIVIAMVVWAIVGTATSSSSPAPAPEPDQNEIIEENLRYYQDNPDEACYYVGGDYNPVTGECVFN